MIGRFTRKLIVLGVVLVLGVGLGIWLMRPGDPPDVRETIVSTIRAAADTSVLVTGYAEVSVEIELRDPKYFPETSDLPWYLVPAFTALGRPQVNLGTNISRVQVPGRISYGFDVSQLHPEHISISDTGRVRVTLPPLDIWSVEPYLEELQVHTDLGWARWYASSGHLLEKEAIRRIRTEMRRQGEDYLATSYEPTMHTHQALAQMLTAPLQAAGIENPTFVFDADSVEVTRPTG